MAEIINLRLARKAKARSEAEAKAEQNRAKFGQTKAEKLARKAETSRASKALDAGRLERGESAEPSSSTPTPGSKGDASEN